MATIEGAPAVSDEDMAPFYGMTAEAFLTGTKVTDEIRAQDQGVRAELIPKLMGTLTDEVYAAGYDSEGVGGVISVMEAGIAELRALQQRLGREERLRLDAPFHDYDY